MCLSTAQHATPRNVCALLIVNMHLYCLYRDTSAQEHANMWVAFGARGLRINSLSAEFKSSNERDCQPAHPLEAEARPFSDLQECHVC